MREREELSAGERDYISSKLTGWKVVSFFLPGLGQMRSRRRGLFWGGACISLGLGFLLGAIGGSDGIEVAGFLGWLINVILTLVKFTEKAYRHDMPYFQKYLYAYAKLSGGNTKEQRRTNLHENNIEDNEDIGGKPIIYSKKSTGKYDKYGFDEDGYNRQGYDAYGFDREGFNRQGFNEEGFDRDGFDKNGYNYKGFDKNGFDKNGYNKRGFDKNGFDKDGYDEYGEKKTEKTKKTTQKKNSTVLNKKSKK